MGWWGYAKRIEFSKERNFGICCCSPGKFLETYFMLLCHIPRNSRKTILSIICGGTLCKSGACALERPFFLGRVGRGLTANSVIAESYFRAPSLVLKFGTTLQPHVIPTLVPNRSTKSGTNVDTKLGIHSNCGLQIWHQLLVSTS